MQGLAHRGSLLNVQPLGQDVGDGDDAHQVVHVAADAAGHARVLDFEHHPLPVRQHRSMHLACQDSL